MNTIIDLLEDHADSQGDRQACVFLNDVGVETGALTYRELYERIEGIAATMEAYDEQDRALIILPTGIDFPSAFYGCLRAGVIAVPVAASKKYRSEVFFAVLQDCTPSCIITDITNKALLETQLMDSAWQDVKILCPSDFQPGLRPSREKPGLDDVAFLQYTSGSTSIPKGVTVSHRNIVANEQMITDAFGHSAETTLLGWAPLYHDQGLIGNMMSPHYVGGRTVLMPPMAIIKNPLTWLRLIQKYKAETSGGPNFAFDMCIKKYRAEDCIDLDLSCWKVAFDGAEPIDPNTVRLFSKIFSTHGFDPKSFFPCYGMAEATLFASGGPHGHLPEFQMAEVGADASKPIELVCCGELSAQMDVMVMKADGTIAADGEIGEICLAGENITRGYWNGRSPESFFICDASGVTYLKTGDLGFVRGEKRKLYVTGRIKELIIVRGRNVYPYDIERTISTSSEGLLAGACAVFTVEKEGQHHIVAVQEVERTSRNSLDYKALAGIVRKRVAGTHEVMIHRLMFAAPGFVPKTSSGKIKRAELARWAKDGNPEESGKIIAIA